ncbi:MAG: 5'-nucleotidase C-terminal domain-containing protein [Elusimicrobia bacterium]|nr:5'-nucleotidase C-terminal domain-containing protein [Elusimicrobiota bacterium]
MKYLRRIAVPVFAAGLFLAAYGYYWNRYVVELDVVYTSDGHGHVFPSMMYKDGKKTAIGGMSALGNFLGRLKRDYLLADSGDIFQGTPEGILTEGRIVVELMDLLGYDVMAVGNHDFDMGRETLEELSGLAGFPMLGANIIDAGTGLNPGYIKDAFITELNGVKVGFTGILTQDMKFITMGENIEGLEFADPLETANESAARLRKKGAEIIILLSHQGAEKDMQLAEGLEGVDIVLGGHTHLKFDEPKKVRRVLICEPGCHFQYAGHLKIYYSIIERKIMSYSNRVVPLLASRYPGKKEIDEFISESFGELTARMNEVIGASDVLMLHRTYGEDSKNGELALGNWQTDMMRELTGCDFAFQNSGGIRAAIPDGDIRVRDVWELSPFGNTLVKMVLKGSQVRRLLEQSASAKQSRLQVSGLKMIYNSSLPEGRRVLNIIIKDEEAGLSEIEDEKEYTVVTNSFLAEGGDGYSVFSEGTEIEDTGLILRDEEIKYIKGNSPIHARIEGRMINVSLDEDW